MPVSLSSLTVMREALPKEELKRIYGRIARRYDIQHKLITGATDQKGRKNLVEHAVREGDQVLDCGAGTGTSGILAARKAGKNGKVVFLDLSEKMLAVAKEKVAREGLLDRVIFQAGDMGHLPFADDIFDVVLSTYSLCPLYDPNKGALELYRVTKPGGTIGVVHSAEARGPVTRWLAEKVADIAWHFPWLSMGCRSVHVLPALERAGAKVILSKYIGIPLWPFLVFIVEKPVTRQSH